MNLYQDTKNVALDEREMFALRMRNRLLQLQLQLLS